MYLCYMQIVDYDNYTDHSNNTVVFFPSIQVNKVKTNKTSRHELVPKKIKSAAESKPKRVSMPQLL